MRPDLTEEYKPQVLIVAHGKVYRDRTTHRLLREADHVIVCDGALSRYINVTTRKPDIVIGDGDSVVKEDLERVGVDFVLVEDQETNDLTKAVNYALDKGWHEISVVGATGRREDHTVGNIFLLPEYMRAGARVRFYSKHGMMMPFEGSITLDLLRGQGISIFATEHKPMSARGVMYPFENRVFTQLWQATLNQVTEPIVELYSEGPALVYVSAERRLI